MIKKFLSAFNPNNVFGPSPKPTEVKRFEVTFSYPDQQRIKGMLDTLKLPTGGYIKSWVQYQQMKFQKKQPNNKNFKQNQGYKSNKPKVIWENGKQTENVMYTTPYVKPYVQYNDEQVQTVNITIPLSEFITNEYPNYASEPFQYVCWLDPAQLQARVKILNSYKMYRLMSLTLVTDSTKVLANPKVIGNNAISQTVTVKSGLFKDMSYCPGVVFQTDISTTVDLGSFFEKGVYKEFEPETCPFISVIPSSAVSPICQMELRVVMTLHFTTGAVSETGNAFTVHSFNSAFAVRDQQVRALYKPPIGAQTYGLVELTIPPDTEGQLCVIESDNVAGTDMTQLNSIPSCSMKQTGWINSEAGLNALSWTNTVKVFFKRAATVCQFIIKWTPKVTETATLVLNALEYIPMANSMYHCARVNKTQISMSARQKLDLLQLNLLQEQVEFKKKGRKDTAQDYSTINHEVQFARDEESDQ